MSEDDKAQRDGGCPPTTCSAIGLRFAPKATYACSAMPYSASLVEVTAILEGDGLNALLDITDHHGSKGSCRWSWLTEFWEVIK